MMVQIQAKLRPRQGFQNDNSGSVNVLFLWILLCSLFRFQRRRPLTVSRPDPLVGGHLTHFLEVSAHSFVVWVQLGGGSQEGSDKDGGNSGVLGSTDAVYHGLCSSGFSGIWPVLRNTVDGRDIYDVTIRGHPGRLGGRRSCGPPLLPSGVGFLGSGDLEVVDADTPRSMYYIVRLFDSIETGF
jgi:hypothetical protein